MQSGNYIRSFLSLLATLALLVTVGATSIGMAPEPDPIPKKWELEVVPGPLRIATIKTDGKNVQRYFYLTYKVTNRTNSDVLFAPSFDLATDDGGVVRSGRDVPADVTQHIIKDLENAELQDQISIVGTLLQGEENALEGVVIWAAGDLSLNEISVFGSGFSGETKVIQVPSKDSGKKSDVTLRKTLSLKYSVYGEIVNMGSGEEFELAEKRWVLR